jgi:maleamate amidohydrolase
MRPRVWDRFLTEQDRAHLAASIHNPVGFGTKPALLLIDNYRWVLGDRPEPLLEAIKTWPGSTGLAGWEAIARVRDLLAVAREVGIPVVHVTGLDDDESGVPGWSVRRGGARRAERSKAACSPEELDRQRRKYDIVDEVAPLPGEVVLRKSSPSAFWGTPLVGQLNRLGVDTIIVAGESTSGCVRASVVDGCTYRYRMIVVEECVYDRHEAAHAINLFDMDQKYADVLPLDEVVQYLRGSREQQPAAAPEQAVAAVGAGRS